MALLVLAFVAVRGFWLHETYGAQSIEPLEFGQLAHDLNAGLLAPLPAYMPQTNEGCGLFFGLWCALGFALFGDSYLTLRLCHLAWHGLMLLVLCGLARRAGGWLGLLAVGGLYVLPPPGIGAMMHRGWFNHLEAWLLLGAGLLIFEARGRRALASGLLLGLAPFFQLSALPAAIGLGAVLGRERAGRRGLLLGAFVGAVPLTLSASLGTPVDGTGASDASFSLGAALAGAGILVAEAGPAALGYRSSAMGSAAAMGAGAGVMLALLAAVGLWAGRGRRVLVGAAVAGSAHLLACLASGLDLAQARYLAPLWPWALVLAAGAPRPWLGLALLLILFNGLQLPAPEPDRMPVRFEAALRGHSLLQHDGLRHALRGQEARVKARLARADVDPWDLCRELGRHDAALPPPAGTLARCLAGHALGRGEADPSHHEGRDPDQRETLGRLSRLFGHDGEAMAPHLARREDPPLDCAALGHWAFETGWHDGGPVPEAGALCRDAQLAVGAGIALAPRLRASALPGLDRPQLRWWWRQSDVPAEAQAAFLCALEAELEVLRGTALSGLPLGCAR